MLCNDVGYLGNYAEEQVETGVRVEGGNNENKSKKMVRWNEQVEQYMPVRCLNIHIASATATDYLNLNNNRIRNANRRTEQEE